MVFDRVFTCPAGIYWLKATIYFTWRRSGVVFVNFEHISHIALAFLLLTCNCWLAPLCHQLNHVKTEDRFNVYE